MLRRIFALFLLSALLSPSGVRAQRGEMPPEIKAIKEKIERGEKMTPDEQQKYADYVKSLTEKLRRIGNTPTALGRDPSKPVRLPEDPFLPKADPSVRLATRLAPSQAQYLALAKRVHAESGARLAEDVRRGLDDALGKLKAADAVSNAGTYQLALGKGKLDAALYLLSEGAVRDPADGVTASNLGVTLKNVRDYEPSLAALLYAESLLPASAVVEANLGWTVAYMGDFPTARLHFNKALSLDPFEPAALEGLGLLARVEGNAAEASKYLRARLRLGFSPVAARKLAEVEEKAAATVVLGLSEGSAEETPGARLQDVPRYPFAVVYDNTGGGGAVEFPNPPDFYSPLPEYITKVGERLFDDYRTQGRREQQALLEQLEQARQELKPLRPEPMQTSEGLVYPRGYEPQASALRDIEKVFARRHQMRFNKFYKRFADEVNLRIADKLSQALQTTMREVQACGGDSECKDAAGRRYCRARTEAVKLYHPQFYTLWQSYYQEETEDLRRYYRAASPWIRAIGDPALNRFENLRREAFIRWADPERREMWLQWAARVQANYATCDPEPPPQNQRNNLRNQLKVFPEPYGDCHVPTGSFDGGVAAIEATCDALKVTFRPGVEVSFERKFGESERDDITTIRFGVDHKVGQSGLLGGAKLKAQGDYYLQFKDGQLIDHGVELSAKGELTVGNSGDKVFKGDQVLEGRLPTASVGGQAGIRISAVSGPSVSSSDGPAVSFGGLAEAFNDSK